MAEQEKKPEVAARRKNHRFGNRAGQSGQKSTYKSKVIGLEEDTFDVGASSDPAKFSKSLKSIENYIQKTYKMPDDIVKAIQQMKRPTLSYPDKPTKAECVDDQGNLDEDEFEMAKFTWKEDYKAMRVRKDKYNENESNAWALIYDQCAPELKNKLEGTVDYITCKNKNDVVSLISMIRSYCCQFDTLNDEYMSIVGAIKNLLYLFQKPTQTNSDYQEDFMAMVEVIEEYGGAGSLTYFPNMIKKELKTKSIDMEKATGDEMKEAKKTVRNKFLAALMLNGANRDKYGDLKRSMAENYVTGTSEYPESPEVVLRILNAYVPPAGWNRRIKQDPANLSYDGALFAQSDGDDSWKANITCHGCGKKGHLKRECPNKKERDKDQMHITIDKEDKPADDENLFVQHKSNGMVNKNYLLLDNQSTVNQIANPSILKNIRKSSKPIKIHCNAGMSKTDLEGELGGMTVYHNPNGIANVLSLKSVAEKHRVTYDSWDRNGVFKVHTKDGVVEFKPSERGLHYVDVSAEMDVVQHMLVTADIPEEEEKYEKEDENVTKECMMVTTVRGNLEGYTRHEIEKAKEARRLQGMIGNPTERELEGLVREKLIANCPVTVQDVHNANRIFGPDLANLRGKTTRKKPEHVRVDYVEIPRDIIDMHKYVTLVADVMFVNGLPFLVSSSRGISLVTIEYLPSRTAKRLAIALERVLKVYAKGGFAVQTMMMDMEFEKLVDFLPTVAINTTAAREHVGEIERKIRVIKERARGTINTLPYLQLPRLMVIELMHFCVMWMNSFPVKSGISEKWSPRELISRHKLDAKLHCKAPFGAYCEVHTDSDITNTMEPRTKWAICLGPTGNMQGSYKFMSLTTGKKIVRRKFTEMPITESVIRQVDKWAQKDRAQNGLTFLNRNGLEYNFGDDDDQATLVVQPEVAPFPDIPAEAPGILAEHEEINGVSPIQDTPAQSDEERAALAAENSGIDFGAINAHETPEVVELLDDDDEDILNDFIQDDVAIKTERQNSENIRKIDEEDEENEEEGPVSDATRKSSRERVPNRKFKDYELYVTVAEEDEFLLATNGEVEEKDMESVMISDEGMSAVGHYIMVHYAEKELIKKRKKKYKPKDGQYTLDAGIKKFGDQGKSAVTKELRQFNTYNVFEPLEANSLSDEEKKRALSSLIFLKEKRNGTVKARSCANGSVQREHVAKEEAASPTVALESVFVTAAIDAKENREVVTIDIPGAFLHAANDDYVVMRMNGTLAELMAKTDPKLYRKYLTDEKGKKVLYLRLQKALYGMMKSALLFYRKLISELKGMGFEINPYDPCVVNKMVNGSQMTVRWHVDDLMISHTSNEAISQFIGALKDIYGNNLVENTGKVHDYLGMVFDFADRDKVKIDMRKYLTKVIADFPEEIIGKAATPAGDHLFKVRDDGRKLNEEQADAFHRTVYQLLFAANRARRDIQTAVSFLTTRVQAPDEDDWGKLKRVLKYLNGTRYLKLTLCAEQLKFAVHWYIDGSHQIHEDCRGQTGSLVTFGRGAVSSSSNIMKCNTKSSTETELISLADKLADVVWMRYFIECQGYDIDEYIIFQDNMSALSLEKNGRISSSKRTKHIKAKYFLIKDYYDAGEIDVKFCPTDEMWADILTKPLQGQKFRDMRAFLQNCPRDYDDDAELKISMKPQDVASSRECVDGHAKFKPILKTKQSSQPRATSPTCVSRVTWDEISLNKSLCQKLSHPTKNPTKMRTDTHHTRSPTKGSCKRATSESHVRGIPQAYRM
jgi:hypothetical protein